jgi:hypothetical protein
LAVAECSQSEATTATQPEAARKLTSGYVTFTPRASTPAKHKNSLGELTDCFGGLITSSAATKLSMPDPTIIPSCSACSEPIPDPAERWPSFAAGTVCQVCWEAQSSRLWWAMVRLLSEEEAHA